MGLEQELRQEIRLTKLRQTILATIQLAGIITVMAMAPNVFQALGRVQKRWSRSSLESAVQRLVTKGLVQKTEQGLQLTPKGQRYLDRSLLTVARPKRWDRKWRIVVFDIKENRRALRDQLRILIGQIGFIRLQNSVWVYPYDCEELLVLLKTDYHLGKEVLYIIADKIERDFELRRHFDLQ